jgi:hypothetical protein
VPPSPSAGSLLPADSGDSDDAGAADPDGDDDDDTVAPPKFSDEEARKRIDDIIRIYPKLKARDYGRNGKPKTARLAQLLRRQVYAAERDTAHAIVQRAIEQRAAESRKADTVALPPPPAPATVELVPVPASVDAEAVSVTLDLPDIASADGVE